MEQPLRVTLWLLDSASDHEMLQNPSIFNSTVFNVKGLYARFTYMWSGSSHSCYHLLSYTVFLLFYPLIILPLPSIPGAIHGLQFNPHKESTHLLASGGADGEVFVMSLEKPDKPNVRTYFLLPVGFFFFDWMIISWSFSSVCQQMRHLQSVPLV